MFNVRIINTGHGLGPVLFEDGIAVDNRECLLFCVKIINGEAVLFKNDVAAMNLESLRDRHGYIQYQFSDGSCVSINSYNDNEWYDSCGEVLRYIDGSDCMVEY